MNKSIKEQRVKDFLKDLASKSPTPGGGAVAAITGAIAASLVEMVCNLTIGKKDYLDVQNKVVTISKEVQCLSKELQNLADKDSKSFQNVIKAYKSGDKGKIKKTLIVATEVPEKTAKYCKKVQELAEIMVRIGNKNAYSDAMSAGHLAFAAMQSAQENIEINKRNLVLL